MSCTVIMPVGPGHQKLSELALQSVMMASEQMGPFERIHVVVGDDMAGRIGRSAARNRMVLGAPGENGAEARKPEGWMGVFSSGEDLAAAFTSEWLFFLDADDLMCSPEFFGMSAFAVVEPLVAEYDAIWGAIYELHPGGKVFKRGQIERLSSFEVFLRHPVAQTCQMGHFVRRAAFERIGGFNEELDVCEDVDLYLREWQELRCIKQDKPLFLNRRGSHSWMQEAGEGERPRATGREWSERAEEMMEAARVAGAEEQ